MNTQKYKETFTFPDGGKAHVVGDERLVQINYIGDDRMFFHKFEAAVKDAIHERG